MKFEIGDEEYLLIDDLFEDELDRLNDKTIKLKKLMWKLRDQKKETKRRAEI